jgi:transcriptional regulator with XRE-family HTH domain
MAELSRRTGADPSTISRVEAGKKRPSTDLIERWSRACGYVPQLVLDGEPETLAEMVALLHRLPTSELAVVGRLIATWPALDPQARRIMQALVDVLPQSDE